MTLSSQLEHQTKGKSLNFSNQPEAKNKNKSKKKKKEGTSSKDETKSSSKKELATARGEEATSSKIKDSKVKCHEDVGEQRPSFLKRALSDLGLDTLLRRSSKYHSDQSRTVINRKSWTTSLSSLVEDVVSGDYAKGRGSQAGSDAARGVQRSQSLMVRRPRKQEQQEDVSTLQGLQGTSRRRTSSQGGPSSTGPLGPPEQYQQPRLSAQTPATSLPWLLKFPQEEVAEHPHYQRRGSYDTNLRTTKHKRYSAFKNDREEISCRSRSLTHIDALETGMQVKSHEMDSRSEPDTTHDRLIVPAAEPPHVRRQKLARSQVSSSEYFSVSFECGDEAGPDEFVPAAKGVSLAEALTNLCVRRGIDLANVNVFLDSYKQPLQVLNTDTAWMGGKHVRVKAKDDKSPLRGVVNKGTNSQVPLRKTAGSYRGKGGRFFSASTEDPSYIYDSGHEGSFKGSKTSKQRWSGLFGNNKDTKMESLVDQLNNYTKHGIPKHVLSDSGTDHFEEELFVVEEDWRTIVANSKDLPERQRHQQTAIWELVQTESAYIHTLKVVTDLFLACLCSLQVANILNEIDTSRLFSNITDIYAANCLFWKQCMYPMIQASRTTQRPLEPQMMLEGFLKFHDLFHPYTKYCAEQLQCQLYCREKHQENEMFTAYLAWCETQKDCNRLRLMDILVKPMQRLTKYSLLLKAVLKNTQQEEQRVSLERMIKSVDEFVLNVNTTLRQKEDHERLRGIIARIESYDVVESKDDELERLLRSYSELDLTSPMPGCHISQRRYLLLESDLKLKDNAASKMDVHCFLLTDMLLVCKSTKRSGNEGRMRVVRQPYVVERLMVHELGRDPPGLGLVYLNEYRTATAAFILTSSEPSLIKSWADGIRKAQDLYAAAKVASTTASTVIPQPVTYDDEHLEYAADIDLDCQSCASLSMGGVASRSPRGGSSRGSHVSSLAHSHSGSMDMNEVSSMSSVSHSRGVSMENELRGSSLSSDEGIPALGPNADSGAKPSQPTPSPRTDRVGYDHTDCMACALCPLVRRSLLCKSPTPNTLSVQVPVYSNLGQSLPNLSLATSPGSHSGHPNPPSSLLLVPPSGSGKNHHHHGGLLSPGHRGVSYPPPSPPRGSLRRGLALSQSRNPPLIKTRHVTSSCCSTAAAMMGGNIVSPTQAPIASTAPSFDFDVPVIAGVSPPSEDRMAPDSLDGNHRTHRHPVMKRLARTENRRYHTAGAIDDIKKQNNRDTSIHKRLSWNCGQGQGQGQGGAEPTSKCMSTESVQSSSGVSSTSSAQFGSLASELEEIGSMDVEGSSLRVVCENHLGYCYDLPTFTPPSPAMEAMHMELMKSQLNPTPADPGGARSPAAPPDPKTPSDLTSAAQYSLCDDSRSASKDDLLHMKDLILTDSSLEAS